MSLIETEELSKHFRVLNRREGLGGALRDLFSTDYRTVKAVDGVSFDIEAGEMVGYIGPNGAGKSTTIKMMTGVLKPSGGSIVVDGRVPYEDRRRNAQIMGAVFGQRTQLWWELPVVESFKILKQIYDVGDEEYDQRMGLFRELVDLESLFPVQVRKLSLGQRTLCDIVASFLHNPKVVFLDEPTIGLDISVKGKIRRLIKDLNEAQDTTIILTTHDLGDVEALCERIIIIDKGKIIYDGDTEHVTKMFGAFRTLQVQLHGFREEMMDEMRARVGQRFGGDTPIVVQHTQPGWTDVTVNQDQVPLLDVLSLMMTEFPVRDVRIVEIAMENVVQKIYDGALG